MAVGSVADMELDEWWDVLNVNVRGPLIWTKAVLPWMRAHRAGTIINVSSRGAYTQHPYASAYCASKAALSQLTSCLAAELADDGIIVLAFGPAALTGLARSLFETEAMPAARRQFYESYFTANPDELLRNTLQLFGFLLRGGADHLSGHYVGSRVDGFDTPDDLRARVPTS
jgi:NAD(P)-dependent dehydrogenase (short-subunit alcohol dehydrogenase family)